MTGAKLHWIESQQEKFIYLFAQAFGNVAAEAYRHRQSLTPDPLDPVAFSLEVTERAIAQLNQRFEKS